MTSLGRYYVARVSFTGAEPMADEIDATLNRLEYESQDDWRVVNATAAGDELVVIFERQLEIRSHE